MEIIISDECILCGKCVRRCRHKVLKKENNRISVFNLSSCKGCKNCESVCPKNAINVNLTQADKDKRKREQILVYSASTLFILLFVVLISVFF